jgi:hypothetical protein
MNTLQRKLALFAFGTVTSMGVIASAADAPKGGEVYQKQQVVDFGDDTIEGDLTKPDGEMFDARKRARHKKLIRYREHFRSEVLQSIRAL